MTGLWPYLILAAAIVMAVAGQGAPGLVGFWRRRRRPPMTDLTIALPPAFTAMCARERCPPAEIIAAFLDDLASPADSGDSFAARLLIRQWYGRRGFVDRRFRKEPS